MEASDASMSHEEETCRFIMCVGSSLGSLDRSKGPLVAMNLDRYNSLMDSRDYFT